MAAVAPFTVREERAAPRLGHLLCVVYTKSASREPMCHVSPHTDTIAPCLGPNPPWSQTHRQPLAQLVDGDVQRPLDVALAPLRRRAHVEEDGGRLLLFLVLDDAAPASGGRVEGGARVRGGDEGGEACVCRFVVWLW